MLQVGRTKTEGVQGATRRLRGVGKDFGEEGTGLSFRSPAGPPAPEVSVPFSLTDGHPPVQSGQPVEPVVRLLGAVCGGDG